jgi:hypothetical protein
MDLPIPPAPPRHAAVPSGWQRFSSACVRAFHAYANWLVGISWWRFFLLALLLLIASGILSSIPPFSWHLSERVVMPHVATHRKAPAKTPPSAAKPGYDITIDEHGVRIAPRAASAASGAASAPEMPAPPDRSQAVPPTPP